MNRLLALTGASLMFCAANATAQSVEVFAKGEGIGLERAIPANERGILCLTEGDKGRIYGGTTGRAAHLFVSTRRRRKCGAWRGSTAASASRIS